MIFSTAMVTAIYIQWVGPTVTMGMCPNTTLLMLITPIIVEWTALHPLPIMATSRIPQRRRAPSHVWASSGAPSLSSCSIHLSSHQEIMEDQLGLKVSKGLTPSSRWRSLRIHRLIYSMHLLSFSPLCSNGYANSPTILSSLVLRWKFKRCWGWPRPYVESALLELHVLGSVGCGHYAPRLRLPTSIRIQLVHGKTRQTGYQRTGWEVARWKTCFGALEAIGRTLEICKSTHTVLRTRLSFTSKFMARNKWTNRLNIEIVYFGFLTICWNWVIAL